MRVHVSLHDVSPAFERQIRSALELAAEFGARPALLVVPDYHGRAPLAAHPEFCAWLRRLADQGHEIVLHGLRHRAEARAPSSLQGRIARFVHQRLVSAGEAEFAALDRAGAATRLHAGERALELAGLRSRAFIAPAWTMPRALRGVLGARGYEYTEDHLRIYDLASGRSRPSLLLNFATRSRVRLLETIAYARLAVPARRALPTRIAIHPNDLDEPAVKRELRRLLSLTRGGFVRCGRELFTGEPPERRA